MIAVLISLLSGLLTHQTDRFFNELEQSNGVTYLTKNARYVVGILGAAPAYLLFRRQQKEKTTDLQNLSDYILLFTTFGLGVQLGYLLDRLMGKDVYGKLSQAMPASSRSSL